MPTCKKVGLTFKIMEIVIKAEDHNGRLFWLNAKYEDGIVYDISRYNSTQHIVNSFIPLDYFNPLQEYLTVDIDKDNFLSNLKINKKVVDPSRVGISQPNEPVNVGTLFLLIQRIIVR